MGVELLKRHRQQQQARTRARTCSTGSSSARTAAWPPICPIDRSRRGEIVFCPHLLECSKTEFSKKNPRTRTDVISGF
jgi:hypothetical protein